MRWSALSVALGAALALASCGAKNTTPGPGDPAGPPSDPGASADGVATDVDQGDPTPGDPGGDAAGSDEVTPGDTAAGDDSAPVVITPSAQLCAAGNSVASSSYHGEVCLSPLGAGGPVSTSASYKLIPGPAHIVEAE